MSLRGQIYRELEGRCTQRIELGGKGYFIKQHFGIGWREILKNILQLRLPIFSAKNEWLAIQLLKKCKINTLEIAGYGCRGIHPAQCKSFLLTKELTQTVSLEDFCRTWAKQKPSFILKQAIIKEVARMASVMHRRGMNHRDFYICHFLLAQNIALLPTPKIYLIDLHRATIRKNVPERWLIKDLAGLYFSSKDIGLTRRDLLRFITEYRQQSWREVLDKDQTFWEKVKQRGDRMYQQHG
jgi:heptose I phosphotransferase